MSESKTLIIVTLMIKKPAVQIQEVVTLKKVFWITKLQTELGDCMTVIYVFVSQVLSLQVVSDIRNGVSSICHCC